MSGAGKTLKLRKQEDKASFVSWRFALLCGCILLALGGIAVARGVAAGHQPG